MKFLSYDGILAQCIRYVWSLFLLNICFLLCCLPIFTIGPAISAMYACFLNESTSSSTIVRFFRAFRENFRKGTLIGLLVLLIGAMLGTSWFFLLTYQPPNNGLMMAALMVLTVLFSSVITFVFALQARYENPVLITLKNAWILSIGKLFSGLLMSFVNLFPIIMFVVNLDVFVNVVAIWIPLGFALQMQINALILRRIFFKLEAAQQETSS